VLDLTENLGGHDVAHYPRASLAATRLSRRHFGALLAGLTTSLALPRRAMGATAPITPLTAPGESLGVAVSGVPRGAGEPAVEVAVRQAALAATDFSWLSRGDRVLIKVVCNSGGGYPFTTDPVALRSVIRLLQDQGAGKVIVADMSGVQAVRFSPDHLSGSSRSLMRMNGLAQTAEAAGAEVQAFEEAGWDGFHAERPREIENWSGEIMMPNVIDEVDHIVLLPRCGRHVLTGSTLGLKAAVGWWRHDSRLVYHRGGATLPQKTAEANSVPSLLDKQRLVLTSATRVLSTFGPDQGYVREPETGLIVASPSVVAHDMLSLAWLLENLRLTPDTDKDGLLNDPHQSATLVGLTNRLVVGFLGGGITGILQASSPPVIPHETIWDDRMLRRAFEVFGGVPNLEMEPANSALAPELLTRLGDAVRYPN